MLAAAADDSLFDSNAFDVAKNLGIFLLVVFWLATVYWVFKDARRRIEDPWLVAMATLLGAMPPFLGPLIYMLFRPPEYIEDVREQELEILAIEERLAERDLPLPGVPRRRGAIIPRLSRLHDAAQAVLRGVRGAARADLAGLPVLRDGRTAGDRRYRRGRSPTPVQAAQVGAPRLRDARAARAARPRCPAQGVVDRARRAPASKVRASWQSRRHWCSSSPTASGEGLSGEVLRRFERRGYELRGVRLLPRVEGAGAWSTTTSTGASRSSASSSTSSHPARCWRSPFAARSAIAGVRSLMGATDPADSAAGHDTRRSRHRTLGERRPWLGLESKRPS